MSRFIQAPFLRILIIACLILLPASQVSQAAPIQTGVYTEDFSSYTHLDYADQAVWDTTSQSLRLRRSNGVLANYGYEHTATVWDSQNHMYVAWVDSRQVQNGVYLQKLDASGNRLWAADEYVGNGDLPVLAAGEDGSVMVVMRYNGVGLMKYNPDGSSAWLTPKSITPLGEGQNPQIAYAGSGMYWVSWMAMTGDFSIDTGWEVEFRAEKIDADGNVLVGPIALSSGAHSGSVFVGKLAVDPSGGAWLIWPDSRNPGDLPGYVQGVTAAGGLIYPQERNLGLLSGEPVITSSTSGVVIAWSNQGIHFERINPAGHVVSSVVPDPSGCMVYGLDSDPDGSLWMAFNCYPSVKLMKFSAVGLPQFAQPITLRENVNGQANGLFLNASGPQVAVSWSDNRTDDKQVRLTLLSRQGVPAWPAERVVNDDPGSAVQTNPVLAVAADGTQFVAWKDNRRGQNNAYVQSLTADGARRWAADILVNDPKAATIVDAVQIALDPTGKLFVSWMETSVVNGPIVYLQRFDLDGNKIWPQPILMNDNFLGNIAMTADPVGGVALAWLSGSGDLLAQRYDEDGIPLWAAPALAGSPADIYPSGLTLAAGPDASLAILWPGGNDHRVFVQRLSASGETLWEQPVAGSISTMVWSSYGQDLVIDSGGNVILVWTDGNNGQVSAQKISPSGVRLWNGGNQLQVGTSIQIGPSIVLGVGDQPIFSTTMGGDFTLHAYTSAGSLSWEASYANGSSGGYTLYTPFLAANTAGNLYAAWQDLRNGNWDIYTTKLSSDGDFLFPEPLQLVTPDSFLMLSGLAVSGTVDTLSGPILEANLTADYDLNGGQIVFSLSNDGGASWEAVAPGVNHRFAAHGSDLRWKAELASDPLWPRAPGVRTLAIEYNALPPGGDDYEIDDTCAEAQPIETAGVAQVHSIHLADDEDWVRFDAQTGQAYAIQANEVGENADLTLTLFDACAGSPLAGSDNPASRNARLEWTASGDVPVWLRVTNSAAGAGLPDAGGYLLSVRGFDPTPLVILAVGTAAGTEQQTALVAAGDRAYNTFLAAGVIKSRLRYFSPVPERDVDGNQLPDDIAAPLSHDLLRDAVQDWARTSGAGLGVPVYLVLLGPAQPDILFHLNAGETVGVEELNLWLSNLEATTGVDHLTVILEAPYSGSFIEPATGTLSGSNRVVVTSTSNLLDSYLTVSGALFSDAFFSALAQEFTLRSAFDLAAQSVDDEVGQLQQPWIDDNGDAVPDLVPAVGEGAPLTAPGVTAAGQLSAGLVAQNRGLDTDRSDAPEIQSAVWTSDGKVLNLSVQARDDVSIQSLSADLLPCYQNPTGGPQPVFKPVRVALQAKAGQPGWYGATVSFSRACRVNLLAQDGEGNRSAPYRIDVGSYIYLPMVRR